MNRITRASLMLAALSTAFPALAQESVADSTARLQLEQLRLAVEKARLEPLTALAAQSGSTASVDGQSDTVEAFTLKHAVYKQAAGKLVARLPQGDGTVKPIVVFGSAPPSLEQWFTFRENAQALTTASAAAVKAWGDAKDAVTSGTAGFVDPVSIFAIAGVALSLMKTDTVIKGSVLKVEDAALATMLSKELTDARFVSDIFDFQMSRTGSSDATTLMSTTYAQTSRATLAESHDAVKRALRAYLGAKPALAARVKAAPDSAEGIKAQNALTAGEGLVALDAGYTALRSNLLASTNGVTNATRIRRQKELAESTSSERPILYILSHSAALTTITKKNLFVGLRSTPATLRAAVRIDYVWMGAEPLRAAVTCLTQAVPFDRIAANGTFDVAAATRCD